MTHSARLTALLAFSLSAGASSQAAQQSVDATERKAAAPKHAGIYHVQSGTWTRGAAASRNGVADVLYSNTAASGYFSTIGSPGSNPAGGAGTIFDEGGLPGTTNMHSFPVMPDRDVYRVNGFQISYCDFGMGGMTNAWEISFYEAYAPCTFDPAPTATVNTGMLPSNGCWTLEIDLAGGAEFDLRADGGDDWDDDPDLDSFGWSYQYVGTDPNAMAGFLIAGDPVSTDPGYVYPDLPTAGTGTYYGPASLCGTGNTGYLTDDFFWLEDATGPLMSGCYFFGGYVNNAVCTGALAQTYASFHMEVYAEQQESSIGDVYCSSPANMTGVGTTLRATGSTLAAADNVTLIASELPPGTFGHFIASDTQGLIIGPGGSFGDLCVVGPIGQLSGPGQVKAADAFGNLSLSTTLGEWTLTAIPTALPPLSYAAMAGMTTNFQLWHRDAQGGVGGSNFSEGLSILWQ